MKFLAWLKRQWTGAVSDNLLDHVPVQTDEEAAERLRRAIKRAAKRHGKAFRTGPREVAREVMHQGQYVVAKAGQVAQQLREEAASRVQPIKRKA